jgi:hypothetical protein
MLDSPAQICSVSVNGTVKRIKSQVSVFLNGRVYECKLEKWILLDEVTFFMLVFMSQISSRIGYIQHIRMTFPRAVCVFI